MTDRPIIAFAGENRVVSGPLTEALEAIKATTDQGQTVLVLDAATARTIDLDLRGTLEEARARLTASEPRKAGRPKLGVAAREVTLLPRHWDWLATQPGGASVALRKLVEAASRDPREAIRLAQEATYRFIMVMAGNRPGLEEANRALFAGNGPLFHGHTEAWPPDVRDHARSLAAKVFA